MNSEVELHIRQNYQWAKLPAHVKQTLFNSQKEYEKCIISFSIKNQVRYRGNLVRSVRKDERRYYEELLNYSRESLMLYPYHLSDVVVKGLRVTPFQYYISVMESIMEQEKSYDSLPNFTAADCVRLLGIGRNEYIDLMNQCRSGRKLFRRKNVKELLPPRPADIHIEPWWRMEVGCVVEEDIKLVSESEKLIIDRIIDHGSQKTGELDCNLVHKLYKKGLVYLDVPIQDDDYIIVPPLEGFVMNRVLGDYFETLLYKIFVSIDEHTSVGELATVLQIDSQSVKNAVSLYCRLGFARKKNVDLDENDYHPTWEGTNTPVKKSLVLVEISDAQPGLSQLDDQASSSTDEQEINFLLSPSRNKRIAFLFDSTLTAFLMMGNLSPGLKNHAVTMFEVGKLSDESLDSLLIELEKISTADSEGEAQRYFDHALILRDTVMFLRHNKRMGEQLNLALDLIRCESLQSLDPETCIRLLHKNYALLVSMAPLSKEIRPISSSVPPHLGPAVPEVNTVWFKLFLYHLTGRGPPSLLLTKGTRLKHLPRMFREWDKLLVTTWGHDPGVLPTANIVFTVNDALCHAAVLVQAYGVNRGAETVLVPFPQLRSTGQVTEDGIDWWAHPAIQRLSGRVDLEHSCGYVTLVHLGSSASFDSSRHAKETGLVENWLAHAETSSPVNGFTSRESADILEAELDNLYLEKGSGDSSMVREDCDSSIRDQNTPSGETLKPSLNALNLLKPCSSVLNAKCDQDEWTLLDCCFGVPLFDAQCNKRICEAIINCELYKTENLEILTATNKDMCLQLLQFIADNQDSGVMPEESGYSGVAFPTRNLAFKNGALCLWEGK